jgi:P-type Ca2+ transporter type 2C
LLQDAFGTYPLTVQDWLLVLAVAGTIVPVLELAKWVIRRVVPVERMPARAA